jgi:osmotically-inducible protein OsmY
MKQWRTDSNPGDRLAKAQALPADATSFPKSAQVFAVHGALASLCTTIGGPALPRNLHAQSVYEEFRMNKLLVGLTGAGAGAALMYMADPHEGARRRARLREAVVHANHVVKAAEAMTSRDVQHRLSGAAARLLGHFVEQREPIDDVLVERVRARLGRLVSHPGAIHVQADHGTVTLRGRIFEAELEQTLKGVAAVRGVAAVENRLESHAEAGRVPALQGPGPRRVPTVAARWLPGTPTTRLMATAAGLALLALALPPTRARAAGGAAGVELLTWALGDARR